MRYPTGESSSTGRGYLLGWPLQDVLAVGVKPEIPQAHGLHKPLRLLELALPAEEGLDKLDTRVLAELSGFSLLAGLKHGGLASLEKNPQLVRQALARLDEVFNHLSVLLGANLGDNLLGALYLPGQLDQEQPHLAGHVRYGSGSPVVVHGPVVDPLPQGIGVEHATQQHDGLLCRVPVLQGVAGGDAMLLGVGLGGARRRRGDRLLGHGSRRAGRGGTLDVRYGTRGGATRMGMMTNPCGGA